MPILKKKRLSAMIHWKPNGHKFYHTYKKRRAKEIIEEEYLAKIAVEATNKN